MSAFRLIIAHIWIVLSMIANHVGFSITTRDQTSGNILETGPSLRLPDDGSLPD